MAVGQWQSDNISGRLVLQEAYWRLYYQTVRSPGSCSWCRWPGRSFSCLSDRNTPVLVVSDNEYNQRVPLIVGTKVDIFKSGRRLPRTKELISLWAIKKGVFQKVRHTLKCSQRQDILSRLVHTKGELSCVWQMPPLENAKSSTTAWLLPQDSSPCPRASLSAVFQ